MNSWCNKRLSLRVNIVLNINKNQLQNLWNTSWLSVLGFSQSSLEIAFSMRFRISQLRRGVDVALVFLGKYNNDDMILLAPFSSGPIYD